MNGLQKAAEILVECGYAARLSVDGFVRVRDSSWGSESGLRGEKVDPFADILEGRRQADAIEDYLEVNYGNLWNIKSILRNQDEGGCQHQWRLNRIKWCLQQLGDKNEN